MAITRRQKEIYFSELTSDKPGDEEILHKSDDEIIDIAINDLNRVFTIKQKPSFQVVTRWENAMPQYTVGHIRQSQLA